MKLDRSTDPSRRGKYSLILNRKVDAAPPAARHEIEDALKVLAQHGVLDHGDSQDSEFFVMRIKDAHAAMALLAYANHARMHGDIEFSREMGALAQRAFIHPSRSLPT